MALNSDAANSNLDAAAEYIAKDDSDLAQKMYAYIRNRVQELAKCPGMGRPGRVFGTRELVIERYSYIIPYRIRENEVQILRVFTPDRNHLKTGSVLDRIDFSNILANVVFPHCLGPKRETTGTLFNAFSIACICDGLSIMQAYYH